MKCNNFFNIHTFSKWKDYKTHKHESFGEQITQVRECEICGKKELSLANHK